MEKEIFAFVAQILKIYLFPRGPQIFDRYLEYLGGALREDDANFCESDADWGHRKVYILTTFNHILRIHESVKGSHSAECRNNHKD